MESTNAESFEWGKLCQPDKIDQGIDIITDSYAVNIQRYHNQRPHGSYQAAQLVSRRMFRKSGDDYHTFIKDVENHYLPSSGRTVFLARNIKSKNVVGFSGCIPHKEKKILEFAGVTIHEDFRGLGKVLTWLREYEGIVLGAEHEISKSYSISGAKHLGKNNFRSPVLEKLYGPYNPKGKEIIESLGYKIDHNWAWVPQGEFYSDLPNPIRNGTDEISLSIREKNIPENAGIFHEKTMTKDVQLEIKKKLIAIGFVE
jgi:hypothetical protein